MAEHYTSTERNFVEFYESYAQDFRNRMDLPFRVNSITFEENGGPSSTHGITLSSPIDKSWKTRHLDGFITSNFGKCRSANERKQETLRCVTEISRLVNLVSYHFDQSLDWQPTRILKVRRERQRSGQSVQVDVDEVEILIPFEDVTPKYGMSIRNEHLLEIDQIWKGIDCITNDEVREVVWRSIDLLARGQRTHSLFNRFIYFWDLVELVVNFLWGSTRPRSNRTEKIREIIALSRDMTENNCLRRATAIRDLLETPWRNKVSNFLKLYFPTRFEEMMPNMDRLYCTRNGIVHIRSHEFSVEDYERVEAQTNLMKRTAQEFTNAVIRTSI